MRKIIYGLLLVLFGTNSLFATDFFVTNLSNGDYAVNPAGSFALALQNVNAAGAGNHRIIFQVAGTITAGDPGDYLINNATATSILIDATSEAPGYTCGNPVVIFDGPNFNQFAISSTNVTFRGLVINNFRLAVTGNGFKFFAGGFNLNAAGTASAGTGNGYCIDLNNVDNAIIGYDGCQYRNVFGGLAGISNVIQLRNGSDNCSVSGNYFGTNRAGTATIGFFANSAIRLNGAQNARIDTNVVMGGAPDNGAIHFEGGDNTGTLIRGNKIGVNVNGLCANAACTALGNNGRGILAIGGTNNGVQILRNVITQNAQHGIFFNVATTGMIIDENMIGVNQNGLFSNSTANYGNGQNGIYFGAAITNAQITDNVISANGFHGITIEQANTNTQILRNIVGLRGDGIQAAADYGNGYSGIRCFSASATATTLVISDNTVCKSGKQLRLAGDATFQAETVGIIMNQNPVNTLTISNNYVGIDRSFNLAGNIFTGIYLFGNGAMGGGNRNNVLIDNNVTGDNGETPGAQLKSHGIAVYQSRNFTISNNYVGIGPGGQNIGNAANGIELNSITNANFAILNNDIAYNKGRRTAAQADGCGGILAFATTNGLIQGNHIHDHVDAGGGFVANHGVVIQQGGQIRIGGTGAGEPNEINNNDKHGIFVMDNADFVEIRRNSIYCNGNSASPYDGMGISLNIAGDPGTVAKPVGNASYAAPGPTVTITGATCPSPGPVSNADVNGTAPANSLVEIFNNAGECKDCEIPNTRGEGKTFLDQVTATAGGTFSRVFATFSGQATVTATAPPASAGCTGGYCRTSRFSVCYFCTLPVTWLSFEGRHLGHLVNLKWITASEKDALLFVVERSVGGSEFLEIGRVNALNLAGGSTYSFTDQEPYNGIAYYRLRQVDTDGTDYFSKVIALSPVQGVGLSIFPNPTNGIVNVSLYNGEVSGTASIRLYNTLGQEVLSKTLNASELVSGASIDCTSLASGTYAVKVRTTQSEWIERLIKE